MTLALVAYEKFAISNEDPLAAELIWAFAPHPEQGHGMEGIADPQTGGVWLKGFGQSERISMSYSHYHLVRDALAQTFLDAEPSDVWVAPELFKERPMYDLINFSDCEGVLGPMSARRLLDAFEEAGEDGWAAFRGHYLGMAEWRNDQFLDDEEQVENIYVKLRRLVQIAADTGFIAFH